MPSSDLASLDCCDDRRLLSIKSWIDRARGTSVFDPDRRTTQAGRKRPLLPPLASKEKNGGGSLPPLSAYLATAQRWPGDGPSGRGMMFEMGTAAGHGARSLREATDASLFSSTTT
jgi:hypothetical protein